MHQITIRLLLGIMISQSIQNSNIGAFRIDKAERLGPSEFNIAK